MFQLLFERSSDAILLFDPAANVFFDCNDAAVALMRAGSKQALLQVSPADLSPPFQPDGRPSRLAAAEITAQVQHHGSHRFEWVARRLDGSDVPLETLATALPLGDRLLHVVVPRDITERKRAEAEVRELNATLERRITERTAELADSEARLRTLLEHAPDAIVVFDGRTGRFQFGNAHACQLYGRAPEELSALTPTDVSPEFQADGRPSAKAAREHIDAALAGGTPVFDWTHRHRSGRLIPTEVRLVRLPAEGQELLRASIIDNSDRKRRERVQQATYEISEAVHAVEDLPRLYARIHQIVAGLMPARNFYIALYDPATALISFPYFVDETEAVPPPFTLGTGLTSYVVRTGEPLLVDAAMNARKGRLGNEVFFEGVPGLRYIESGVPAAIWLGVPLSAGGKPFGAMALQDYHDDRAYGDEEKQLLSFVADQTALAIERKRAQQALRESEAKFRALFEATSTGVMIHDEERYLEVNPAVLRMFGCQQAADLIGRNPVATSPPFQPGGRPTAELAHRYIAECASNGTARFDWVARRMDGTDFPIEVILTSLQVGGRRLMQAVVNDISEHKRAEAEMWRALERERELSQLKSNFVSMVSHEFRTPLGIILSSAQILADYLDQLPAPERRDHLTAIAHNAKHMASLMEEVLVLSRVESGRLPCEPHPLDLAKLCRLLVDEVRSTMANPCRVDLKVSAECAGAFADERLLRHILTNLLSNALKYSPANSLAELAIARDEHFAVCRIRDRGIGIPEADLGRLFNAFHRGGNVEQVPGSGLGLVIVKRCVELHGGTIQVESQVGEGTTVTVRLPLFNQFALFT
jgi:PAS domain S-box-containing protein